VLPGSVRVTTRVGDEAPLAWAPIDDLAAAAPEVPVGNPRSTARELGAPDAGPTEVFELDAEAGELRFGDGLRGRRLPLGARVQAAYEFSQGAAGNVAEGEIDSAPQLPSGFTVFNPVQTWGGADAEDVARGEKQVRRYLQHRDRLVSVDDFEAVTLRAPGVQIGRVEILPAFHPDLVPNEPGAAPGVVTILAIPKFDPAQPDAPRADRLFLNALCRHLDPRRLVTTELVVRGPVYKGLWISVGLEAAAGFAIAEVVEAVKQRLRAVLAPVGPNGDQPRETPLFTPRGTDPERGWPLRTAVDRHLLLAEMARVAGVTSVADVLLAEGLRAGADVVEMTGLELPRVLGISVVAGEPLPLDALRGGAGTAPASALQLLPVPVVPEAC
jgi:predicted phage baseplate assembly protein